MPSTGRPSTSNLAVGCSWFNRDTGRGLEYAFTVNHKNGLSDTYGLGRSRFRGYFEPTRIDGYPAVFADIRDFRKDGTCNVYVGISDTAEFRAAAASLDLGARSCVFATQLARAIIATLKAG